MSSPVFNSVDNISFLIFLSAYKLACDTNEVPKGSALCLLNICMKRPKTVAMRQALYSVLSFVSLKRRAQEIYPVKAPTTLSNILQLATYSLSQTLVQRTLASHQVNCIPHTPKHCEPRHFNATKFMMNLFSQALFERYLKSVCQSLNSYWCSKEEATVWHLPLSPTSLKKLQTGS